MKIREILVGSKQPAKQQHALWNMIGSTIYAIASLLLTYLTIRMIGPDKGGIFAIGLTLAQMFVYIAYYETRNYEVTDPENRYGFQSYHAVKTICCVAMMLVCVLYCILKQYDRYKFIVVMLVCIYRMLDGYADVYEGQFHKDGRLDLAGKSMAYRTVISVAIYLVTLAATKDLIVSLLLAVFSGILGILVFDVLIISTVKPLKLSFEASGLWGILKDCFPLFVGMFLWTYLLSASRIAVDNVMTSAEQSYYQVLFLPVSVINLFAGFMIRPSLIPLTELYAEREVKTFWGRICKMMFLLAGFTLFCMIMAYILGIPVLQLLAGCNLREYRLLFVFLIFAGGFNAAAYLLYYVLTIFRKQASIMLGYGTASVVALLSATRMTEMFGLWGAAMSYLISIVVLLIVFAVVIIKKHIVDKHK